MSDAVETATLRRMTRSGAASPVGGMNRLAPQQASEKMIIRKPNEARIAAAMRGKAADDGAEQNGNEGRAFDQRVAGRELGALEVIGQDAVLDRAEQRPTHAETE